MRKIALLLVGLVLIGCLMAFLSEAHERHQEKVREEQIEMMLQQVRTAVKEVCSEYRMSEFCDSQKRSEIESRIRERLEEDLLNMLRSQIEE